MGTNFNTVFHVKQTMQLNQEGEHQEKIKQAPKSCDGKRFLKVVIIGFACLVILNVVLANLEFSLSHEPDEDTVLNHEMKRSRRPKLKYHSSMGARFQQPKGCCAGWKCPRPCPALDPDWYL